MWSIREKRVKKSRATVRLKKLFLWPGSILQYYFRSGISHLASYFFSNRLTAYRGLKFREIYISKACEKINF
jgi:hypothetical protein